MVPQEHILIWIPMSTPPTKKGLYWYYNPKEDAVRAGMYDPDDPKHVAMWKSLYSYWTVIPKPRKEAIHG